MQEADNSDFGRMCNSTEICKYAGVWCGREGVRVMAVEKSFIIKGFYIS